MSRPPYRGPWPPQGPQAPKRTFEWSIRDQHLSDLTVLARQLDVDPNVLLDMALTGWLLRVKAVQCEIPFVEAHNRMLGIQPAAPPTQPPSNNNRPEGPPKDPHASEDSGLSAAERIALNRKIAGLDPTPLTDKERAALQQEDDEPPNKDDGTEGEPS